MCYKNKGNMIVNVYIPNWYSHSYTFQACYQFLCQIIVYLHSQYLQWAIIQHGTNRQELSVPAQTGCHRKNIQIQLLIRIRLQRCNRRVQRQNGTAISHAHPRRHIITDQVVATLHHNQCDVAAVPVHQITCIVSSEPTSSEYIE